MTGTQLGYIAVVVTIIAGLAATWYAARQFSLAQEGRRQAVVDKAVTDARIPLLDRIAELDRTIARRDATIAQREARIDTLEDELRRGRGHGDDDRLRQPRR